MINASRENYILRFQPFQLVTSANTDIEMIVDKKATKKPTLKTWGRNAWRSPINHPMPLVEGTWLLHFVGLCF